MANPVELTVEEKLDALYNLQKIDSKIDEIQRLRGELPMEVSDLEDELEGLKTRSNNLDNELNDLKEQISKNKNSIKEAEALIEKYEKQQGNVRNNREYDALTKEMELANLDIQLANKKIKDAEAAIEGKQEIVTETAEKLSEREKDLEAKKEELKTIYKETEKEELKLRKDSEKASKLIEPRLINAYSRIRSTYRNGLAVVQVQRQSCGGCFAKVPPQRQLEIRQRKKILVCEHCGRVLVDYEFEG